MQGISPCTRFYFPGSTRGETGPGVFFGDLSLADSLGTSDPLGRRNRQDKYGASSPGTAPVMIRKRQSRESSSSGQAYRLGRTDHHMGGDLIRMYGMAHRRESTAGCRAADPSSIETNKKGLILLNGRRVAPVLSLFIDILRLAVRCNRRLRVFQGRLLDPPLQS